MDVVGKQHGLTFLGFLFTGRKDESWWLVLGDPRANSLMAIKRVTLGQAQRVKLDFSAPASAGKHRLMLYFLCDSWMGCDQEYEVELVVGEGEGAEAMEQD